MSVLIRGMEMPICRTCPVCDEKLFGNYCRITEEIVSFGFEKGEKCPLISVPPHGRLIDADALDKLFEDQWHYLQVLDWNENPTAEATQSGINWCINTMHDDAPTIIPAEEGE